MCGVVILVVGGVAPLLCLFRTPISLYMSILFSLFAELYKMVCDPDETDLNIHIPAVMLPLDAGARLEKMLTSTSSGELSFDFQNISGCFFVHAMWKL